MLLEGLHRRLERTDLGEPIAIVAEGVLVGHGAVKVEPKEMHLTEPIPDHELHARIRESMIRLNYQPLKHSDRLAGGSLCRRCERPGSE